LQRASPPTLPHPWGRPFAFGYGLCVDILSTLLPATPK